MADSRSENPDLPHNNISNHNPKSNTGRKLNNTVEKILGHVAGYVSRVRGATILLGECSLFWTPEAIQSISKSEPIYYGFTKTFEESFVDTPKKINSQTALQPVWTMSNFDIYKRQITTSWRPVSAYIWGSKQRIGPYWSSEVYSRPNVASEET